MDSITFKNFRKFKEETTFDLNMINILVGPNSSGKSTLTKGLRLYLYNLQNLKIYNDNLFNTNPFFVFGGNVLNNPHIGTFGRALSKGADEDIIVFRAQFLDLSIETTVSRYSFNLKKRDGSLIDYFDKTIAPITKIVIFDKRVDARFSYDFENQVQTAEFNVTGEVDYYSRWRQELADLIREIREHESSWRTTKRDDLEECVKMEIRNKMTWYSDLLYVQETTDLLHNLMHSWREIIRGDKQGKEYEENKEFKEFIFRGGGSLAYIWNILDDATEDFFYVNSEYNQCIEAHAVTRSIVYNISDKNDYMAQTICDFMNENIKDGDSEKEFIRVWMKKFDIGEDFRIESYGGESYKMEIVEDMNQPGAAVPLLDKGIGDNQLMILLMRLATIMHKDKSNFIPRTIIVEEPEQNLHPKWQSLLADLFYEVYQYPKKTNQESWGFTLLVETHSEYLVRRVQVLTAMCYKQGKEDVPFTVFYFTGNNNNPYYDMGFQRNGKFEKPFGEGFFNVADDEAMKLFDLDNKEN